MKNWIIMKQRYNYLSSENNYNNNNINNHDKDKY